MLRVALPNKGTLAEPAAQMIREAGYRQRTDSRDLSMMDDENDIEFFYLRPKDISTYVGSGDLQLGITGADLMLESGKQVQKIIDLGFGMSKFRFACAEAMDWQLEDLNGKRIATSYPHLVRAHLARNRIRAEIVKLDGAVEISVQLGLADAVADVVSSGRTLRQHNLKPFGATIAESQAAIIERESRPDRIDPEHVRLEKSVFIERLRGVAIARRYLMIEYDCPRAVLEAAKKITPGLHAPTIADTGDPNWVAVRAMALRNGINPAMDRLAGLGAKAILTTDIRSCRAIDVGGGDARA